MARVSKQFVVVVATVLSVTVVIALLCLRIEAVLRFLSLLPYFCVFVMSCSPFILFVILPLVLLSDIFTSQFRARGQWNWALMVIFIPLIGTFAYLTIGLNKKICTPMTSTND